MTDEEILIVVKNYAGFDADYTKHDALFKYMIQLNKNARWPLEALANRVVKIIKGPGQ